MLTKWWSRLLLILLSGLFLSGCTLFEQKNLAGLQVKTEDIPTAVFLNDQYLDQTPLINKELKPGTYELRLEPNQPELASYQTQVTLRKNLLTVVNWKPGEKVESSGGVIYELEAIGGKRGEISFVTIPDNVLVKLEDREQTFSPVTYQDLAAGTYQFSLFLTAYEKQEHTLEIPKGHRVTVTAKLARLDDDTFSNRLNRAETATLSAREASLAAQLTPTADATQSGTVLIQPTGYFENDQEVLRVRATPDITSQQLGVVSVGESYPYLGQEGDNWYQIKFEDQTGWVSASYAQLNQE